MGDAQVGDWKPPNEAEMKVIEARRERNDQISRLMSGYLLKGYRMLDGVCSVCQTVLLRSSDGQDYCVACQELESETSKDDPAVSQQAAAQAVLEQHQRQRPPESHGRVMVPESGDGDRISESEAEDITGTFATGTEESTTSQVEDEETEEEEYTTDAPDIPPCIMQRPLEYKGGSIHLITAYLRLKSKIDRLSKRLVDGNGLAETKEICEAIKACADTALSIKKLL